jgi:hypothetical protein
MADKKKLGALGALGKRLLAERPDEVALTAAQRAEAGRKAAELIKSQPPIKASEALGQLMEKGFKRTTTTQADRTRVGGGNIGGAPFSAISEADPAYAGKVWGVMDEGTAKRLTNLTTPETAWTTMLGSANQLKTNPIVFDKLKRQFIDAMKQGKLSPELEAKINHNLALNFGEGAQIRDPSIWKQADTFDKRAALADLMMGQGITPKKGGVALGGEKSGKGVIFKPTDTLKRETEPSLLHTEHGGDTPTFAAGPRLFRIDKETEYRPDLHPGFPTLLTGKDLEVNMIPTPTEVYLPEWHKQFKKKNPNRKPSYYDLALGVKGEGLPSQELNDEYIRHLLREGFKDGGTVSMEEADAQLAKAIENRMAKGGEVDMADADARLTEAIAQRMAGGGKVKGAAKVFKKLFADDVLPAAEREANKAKFLESSKVKQPVYHGTADTQIREFKGNRGVAGHFAIKPKVANYWADMRHGDVDDLRRSGDIGPDEEAGGMVYPAYVQAKNIFDVRNPTHRKLIPHLDETHNAGDQIDFDHLESYITDIQGKGFDSYYDFERGHKREKSPTGIAVFRPQQIKSAIGNRGTYDISDPDITKASGGLAMAKGGKLAALGKLGKRLLADPEAVTPSVSGGTRKFGDDPSGLSIMKETGGNWLGGDVEKSLKPLRQKLNTPESLSRTNSYDPAENLAGIEKTWTPELIEKQSKIFPRIGTAVEEAKAKLKPQAALNNWVDRNLTNYVKKQMGTIDDPVRNLAEDNITHLPPDTRMPPNMSSVVESRKMAGFPDPVGKSPLAQTWEAWADKPIGFDTAGVMQNIGKGEPWMDKVDPFTRVHGIAPNYVNHMYTDLGFDHIVDVLKEDLAAGRIRPEQLNKISMEQAVRRTHEYNETLKANMLNARIAEQANANVFKEYPEGYRWVQLDKPGQFNLESDIMGHSVRGYEPPKGHPDYTDISGDSGYDTYGHGGYEAIKAGKAKVYSLRDPKGQSHVTVEVGQLDKHPIGYGMSGAEEFPRDFRYEQGSITPEQHQKIYQRAKQLFNPESTKDIASHRMDVFQQAADEVIGKPPEQITQIKGKQNAAPNEEYLPFVQDFVRSGQYSDVGDLKNAGLYKADPDELGMFIPSDPRLKNLPGRRTDDLRKAKEAGLFGDKQYLTRNEWEDILRKQIESESGPLPPAEGMAEGGGAFKKIQFMGGGGITTTAGTFSAEDLGVSPSDLDASKYAKRIARNAADLSVEGKEQLEKEYRQLANKGAKKDALIRIGSQILGSGVDFANLGLEGLDLLQSAIPALSKPESVLDVAGTGDRVPKFRLATDEPFLGSEHFIRKFKEAKLLGENEFPLTEIVANLFAPAAAVGALKKGKQAYEGAKLLTNKPKKKQGGLTAMAR